MINILFAAVTDRWDQYQRPLKKELDLIGLDYKLSKKLPPPEVDYIIYAPNSSIKDFSVYPCSYYLNHVRTIAVRKICTS